MMRLIGGGLLVEDWADLPAVPAGIPLLFADFETTSGDPRKKSINPWRDCSVIGVALSFGHDSPVWFVPKRFLTMGWWRDVLAAVSRCNGAWANANVKYDAHVSANDLNVVPTCELLCLTTGAKLVDSDRGFGRGTYELDSLAFDWCGLDSSRHARAFAPYLHRNKDYGRIPLELMADYACDDIVMDKALHLHEERWVPESSREVWATEREVTSLLFEMERTGVCIDPTELEVTQLKTLMRLLELEIELEELVGRNFRPAVNGDCYDVLCAQYGLPILGWTDNEKNPQPSFDKHVLALYLNHPYAPPGVVGRMLEYRSLDTFNNLFLKQWDVLNLDGVMHSVYNQTVRTGRMSCSKPNMQQLNKMAKMLIRPPPGYAIVSFDAANIEFRVIAHYIESKRCIDAFNADPWTDFHVWTANMAGITRQAAKTLNFMCGYGAGRPKTVAALSINKEMVGSVIEAVDHAGVSPEARGSAIASACERRAGEIYDAYHALLPELKPTAREAARSCERRGYVRNHYGRCRHLKAEFSYKAFNSACQSTAGDIFKERMVALRKSVPEIKQVAAVHDDVVGIVPLELVERDEDLLRTAVDVLNRPARPLRMPIRWTAGWSPNNWLDTKTRERKF